MTEPTRPRRGKDFLIGFLGSLLIAGLSFIPLITHNNGILISVTSVLFLIAIIVAFIRKRPMIAVGIITTVVVIPLLLVGSCFALFAFNS